MINDDVLAIILGGGQGSRLYPLTAERSKPAVPIAGKYRLVDIPISNCLNAGINRMFVLTQFNSASLNRHIKNTYNFGNFSEAFVDLLAAEQTMSNQEWFQGTADAVRQSMHHFLNHEFKYVLILSGDQLYQMDCKEIIRKHEESGAKITIATQPVTASDGTSFGILKTDKNSIITSFTEKPNATEIVKWESTVSKEMGEEGRKYLASMGIYVFDRDLLVDLLLKNPDAVDFGKEIIPGAISKYKTLGFQYEGYWTDIGNIDSFFEANINLTNDIPKFNLYDNDMRIYTRARILPTSKISGTSLDHAVIADGCIIQANVIRKSVIGIRSRIGKGSSVINSYMMGADSYESLAEVESNNIQIMMGIGENCEIENAIIDKNARIGDNVIIRGGDKLKDGETETLFIKDGIVVIKKGATVPHGFVLE